MFGIAVLRFFSPRWRARFLAAPARLMIVFLTAAAGPQSSPLSVTERIDQIATDAIAEGAPGVTIGIDDPEFGRFLRSYGRADAGGSALTPFMHFRIGSVTKTFTALAILRLVDQGEVRLDDPIEKYVPGFPYGTLITIRELLAMRGGVYGFTHDADFWGHYEVDPTLPDWTPSATLALVERHALDFSAAHVATNYSNSEYILLGFVIQSVTGESAEVYLDSLAQYLGLKDTFFRLP